MTNFNNYLLPVSLIIAFGLSWSGVSSDNDLCPVKFPEGFFCDVICEKWGILTGNTIMCFLSTLDGYKRFVARNPAFGDWRFYEIDTTSSVEAICENTVTGDEFFLNDTDITCGMPPKPKTKRFNLPKARASKFRHDDSTPSLRSELDDRVPMDAICEVATTQLCHQGKFIRCVDKNICCYVKIHNKACDETTLSQYSDCYKVLYSILSGILM